MSVSENLYAAILAMDSYNRLAPDGGGVRALAIPGDDGGAQQTIQVGEAILRRDALPTDYQQTGFFATAYDLSIGGEDKTIISFRGTDEGAGDLEADKDKANGWTAAVGLPAAQIPNAEAGRLAA